MIYVGDCREVMATLAPESVDAIVTDPPYGLEFMGKEWDAPWQQGKGTGEHNAGFSPGAPAVKGVRGAIKALPSYTGSTNPTCRNCGGTRNGNDRASRQRCACDAPAFPNTTLPRMMAFQEWSESWAREAYRVLKPGGHLVAFGGSRTYHRLACAIEDAGFEIRDQLQWLYGSGFPKSLDVSKAMDAQALHGGSNSRRIKAANADRPGEGRARASAQNNGILGERTTRDPINDNPATDLARQWDGWGTALKPAHEPIVLARKPLIGTVAANVTQHGTGALNIDGCRIETGGNTARPPLSTNKHEGYQRPWNSDEASRAACEARREEAHDKRDAIGRWPANVVLDEEAGALLDAQSGISKSSGGVNGGKLGARIYGEFANETIGANAGVLGDTGGASRFFYCAKSSRSERNAGLEGMPERKPHPDEPNGRAWDIPGSKSTPRSNFHPTVKPISLMRWLCRLVTPPGGVILDPFMGSGTTGCAAVLEGMGFLGIEMDPEYAAIAERRIAHWGRQGGMYTNLLEVEGRVDKLEDKL